ncbi:MAG TPA: LysR family transcriptional regulator [Chloroflexota bacterium]|nr:LysR family transcriptional regulator [Chloroflexota bacterium]
MYLEQLRSFCAVIDQGSYTRAARQLSLTQPAVSQHVRSLEQLFGIPLVQRVGGRMQPTEAGEAIYRHAAEILAQADAMRSAVLALKGLQGGRVTIGASPSVGNYLLPQIVVRFRRRYPGVSVQMFIDKGSRVFEQVLRGAVDFGIALGYQVPRGLHTEPLFCEPVVLVVSPSHPIVRRWPKGIPRAALAGLPLVALPAQTAISRRLCDEWLREAGVEPRIEMEFDTTESIKRVVAGGIGGAFLFANSVALDVAAGQLTILPVVDGSLCAQFVVAGRQQQYFTPAARAFLEAAVAGLQENRLVSNVNTNVVKQFMHYKGSAEHRARLA